MGTFEDNLKLFCSGRAGQSTDFWYVSKLGIGKGSASTYGN